MKHLCHREASINGERHNPHPGFTCGSPCYMLVREVTDVDLLPTHNDSGLPFIESFVPGDSTVHRRGTRQAALILSLLATNDGPEIQPPIIQPVPVDVIPFDRRVVGDPQDISVHSNRSLLAVQPDRSDRVSTRVNVPGPLVDVAGIGDIDNGIGCDFPLSLPKGNKCSAIVLRNDSAINASASQITGGRAVRLAGSLRRLSTKERSAHKAGTLNMHRVNSGVSPRVLAHRWGTLRCDNYTRSLRVNVRSVAGERAVQMLEAR